MLNDQASNISINIQFRNPNKDFKEKTINKTSLYHNGLRRLMLDDWDFLYSLAGLPSPLTLLAVSFDFFPGIGSLNNAKPGLNGYTTFEHLVGFQFSTPHHRSKTSDLVLGFGKNNLNLRLRFQEPVSLQFKPPLWPHLLQPLGWFCWSVEEQPKLLPGTQNVSLCGGL